MSHGLKMILIAAGTIISCVLVVTGFNLVTEGKGGVRKVEEQYRLLVSQAEELNGLNGRILSGQEVMDYMKLYAGCNLYFQVKTALSVGSEGVYYHRTQDLKQEAGEYHKSELAQTDADYINPCARFDCTVKQNENEIPIGLKFVQRRG